MVSFYVIVLPFLVTLLMKEFTNGIDDTKYNV